MSSHILPDTSRRVELHTKHEINEKIRAQTIIHINQALNEDQGMITNRINQLDREWDTERLLETNATILILISILLAVLFSFWWLLLAAGVAAFLLQHALQGWCPPLPVFRKMGKRTSYEISTEKTALKYLRGDFNFQSRDGEKIIRQCEVIDSKGEVK
ncbi:MAG: hypothetical protein K0Q65_3004 [Clostridia bacterium]|jgi:hypothetical protein|nr:hypothetical protein [Clostridia bacterium]